MKHFRSFIFYVIPLCISLSFGLFGIYPDQKWSYWLCLGGGYLNFFLLLIYLFFHDYYKDKIIEKNTKLIEKNAKLESELVDLNQTNKRLAYSFDLLKNTFNFSTSTIPTPRKEEPQSNSKDTPNE